MAALHDLLRRVGLFRLRKGDLSRTRAAEDEVEVVRRLRSRFSPDDGFISSLATDNLASLITEGPSGPKSWPLACAP